MDAYKSAAGLNESLQMGLLAIIEYVARCVQEDDSVRIPKTLFSELRRIVGNVNLETVPLPYRLYSLNAIVDRIVAICLRCSKYKYARF